MTSERIGSDRCFVRQELLSDVEDNSKSIFYVRQVGRCVDYGVYVTFLGVLKKVGEVRTPIVRSLRFFFSFLLIT